MVQETVNTMVLWECCSDKDGEPFNPNGSMYIDKAEALEELRESRERCPDTYLVKVVLTRCTPEEEQIEVGTA